MVGNSILGENENDLAGRAVSLSESGRRVAFSEYGFDSNGINNVGRVRIFQYNSDNNEWNQLGDPVGVGLETNDYAGQDVKLSGDGTIVAVAAFQADNDNAGINDTGSI